MKISLISAGISTHSGLRVVIELAIALKKNGHNITIFAPKKNSSKEAIKYLNIFRIRTELINEKNTLRQIFKLKQKLQKEAPEIISAHCMPSQLLAAWLTGIPIVWTYYGTQYDALSEHSFPNKPFWIAPLNNLTNIIITLKVKFISLLADEIIAISNATALEMKKKYNKTTTTTIPFGSTPSTLKPKTTTPKPKTMLSVSRITPYKGFHTLIEVVKNLKTTIPDIKLVIAGSAPQKKYLSYLRKIKGSETTIHVNPSDNQLTKLYANASIYVTADKYLFYGLPIWEAASFSLPTVAMNFKAAPEAVVHGKTGFISNNKLELQNHIQKLLTNSKMTKTFGKNALLHSQQRTWKQSAHEYEQIFKTTLKKSFQPLAPELFEEMFQNHSSNNRALADLGSDTGINLLLLDKLDYIDSFSKIYAVDKIKPKLDKKLRKKNPSIKAVTADITNLKTIPTNSIDIALLTQVIEHIENQHQAMQEIIRVLKPEGKLLITSVAKKWYGIYWHRNKKGQITVHPDHVHEFQNLKELKNLISDSGLKVIKSNEKPGKLPLLDYFIRTLNLAKGQQTSSEHRGIYFSHPKLIRWKKHLNLPLPGYSLIEAIAKKENKK